MKSLLIAIPLFSAAVATDPLPTFLQHGGTAALAYVLYRLYLKALDQHRSDLKEEREQYHQDLATEREQCLEENKKLAQAIAELKDIMRAGK